MDVSLSNTSFKEYFYSSNDYFSLYVMQIFKGYFLHVIKGIPLNIYITTIGAYKANLNFTQAGFLKKSTMMDLLTHNTAFVQ